MVPHTSISAILQVTVSPRKNTAARKEAGRETQRDCDCSRQDSNRSAVREVLASHRFTPCCAEVCPKAPNRARITVSLFSNISRTGCVQRVLAEDNHGVTAVYTSCGVVLLTQHTNKHSSQSAQAVKPQLPAKVGVLQQGKPSTATTT